MPRPREPARLDYDQARGVWAIRDTVNGKRCRRRTRHGFEHREAAAAELALHIAEQARLRDERAVLAPDPDDLANQNPRLVTVAACLAHYAGRMDGTPNAELVGLHVENLLRHWGDRTLLQVKEATCRAYWEARTRDTYAAPGSKKRKPVSLATARRELETLSAAIGAWHRAFTLSARPLVSLPDKSDPHPDWLTETEYARLLRVAQGWRWVASDLATREPVWERARDDEAVAAWRAKQGRAFVDDTHLERFCQIAFYSGTRSGAILGLRWQRDAVDGWVDFPSTTLFRQGPKAPRTRKRQPPCRIHDRLLPLLREWHAADLRDGAGRRDAEGRPAPITHVVHERGAAIDRVDKAFVRAATRAGLDRRDVDGTYRVGNPDPADDLGWPTPHILRHTRATLMLRAGVPPHEVGEYLGMSVKMVLNVYGHHHSEHQRRAAAA